jgi:hypothetical protein
MADTVTSRKLFDSVDRAVFIFTSLSDGSGESAVKKIDVSELVPACSHVGIEKIWYNVSAGFPVTILEDATTDVTLLMLQGDGVFDFTQSIGELPITFATGWTGDIMFTSKSQVENGSYSIMMQVRKHYKAGTAL